LDGILKWTREHKATHITDARDSRQAGSWPFGNERVLRGGTGLQWHKLKFRCAMRQSSTPAFTKKDFTGMTRAEIFINP